MVNTTFIGRVMSDLAANFSGVATRLGHRLGMYRALTERPMTSAELSAATGILERYASEWLYHQYAAGYIELDLATGKFSLPEEHAMVLADSSSPACMMPAFDVASALWRDEDMLVEAFRNGRGIGWGEHHPHLFCGTEGFFRNSYAMHLTSSWIPALSGVETLLKGGAQVADIGCGHGASTILMSKAYPASQFVGYDLHEESVRIARERAKEQGVDRRVRFEVAAADEFPGSGYDFIAFMDCFHDLGDPVSAARHSKQALTKGGTLMLVEPFAGAKPEENRGPVAQMYYAASLTCCVPNAVAQSGRMALGAQAGPVKLQEALEAGGFEEVRLAASTPFNLVLEARA